MGKLIKLPSGLVEVEHFMDHYGVPYDAGTMEGKRIPIMLRFRFYLEAVELEDLVTSESTEEEMHAVVKTCLEKAYRDVNGKPIGATSAPSWAEGCLTTSACSTCKSTCNS